MYDIIDTASDISFFSKGTYFIKDANVKLNIFNDQFRLTDLTDALKTGKTCKQVSVCPKFFHKEKDIAVYNVLESITDFQDFIHNTPDLGEDFDVYTYDNKSVSTFSPFNLTVINPLKELPKKWTIRHVIRALLTGQAINVRRDSRYTDDYAYDASTNYGACDLNALDFAYDLLECGHGGWWVSNDGNGRIGVNCHHFLHNSFELKLKG